jgi:hypothetical protein
MNTIKQLINREIKWWAALSGCALVLLFALVLIHCLEHQQLIIASDAQQKCVQLCDRTFKQCSAETLAATGNVSPRKLEQLKESGVLAYISVNGHIRCVAKCREIRAARTHAEVASFCLLTSDCLTYARCVANISVEE